MMFFKLSLSNIKKSMHNYTIYFMTLIFGVAIFYTFNSIDSQTAMLQLSKTKSDMVQSIIELMSIISVVVSIILGYLIVYANNFLIRRRKKEFGLYQTLGMSKRKIGMLLLIETIFIGIISLVVGLFIGIFLSQGMSILIIHMFEANISQFQFSFSSSAMVKSILYFGIIYVLVMLFNVVTVSRYKLITLLNASKRNEKLKIKNNTVSFLLFLAAVACIGYAYYLLREEHVLLVDQNKTILMLVLGTVGTYLFFSSLAGFLIKLVQTRKRIYLKNLNMFMLRQINSRINTMKISLTVISIMLLLTIGIMASALSLVNVYNGDLTQGNRVDFTMIRRYSKTNKEQTIIKERLKKDGFSVDSYVKEGMQYEEYIAEKESDTANDFIGEGAVERLKKAFGGMVVEADTSLPIIKLSDYNKILKLYGEKQISLAHNEFILVANFKQLVPLFNEALNSGRALKVAGVSLAPAVKECVDISLENTNMQAEMGTVVVPDYVVDDHQDWYHMYETRYMGKFVKGDEEELTEKMQQELKDIYQKEDKVRPYSYMFTKVDMAASQIGTTVMFTFIGLYLGVIFSITSAAILAIGQLSESSDNKERYAILRKIGVDEKMINHSLFMQIGIYFLLPLLVAIVHSFVGLTEVSRLISIFGHIQIEKNILLTALFIIIVYGGYFIATYLGSKGIIKENTR